MALSVADYRLFADILGNGVIVPQATVQDYWTVMATLRGIAAIQERILAAGGNPVTTIDQLINRIRTAYPAEAAAFDLAKQTPSTP